MIIPHRRWLLGVAGLALASGWIGVAANRLLNQPHTMDSLGSGVWIATPLAAVLITRLLKRSSARSGWRLALPEGWPWYAIGIAFFPAVNAITIAIGRGFGWIDTSAFDGSRLVATGLAVLAPAIVKNIFEEGVWRGYFTSEFVQRRFTDVQIYAAVGLIWALWHLPYYLYFLPDHDMRSIMDVSRPTFALAVIPVIIAWTVPYTELYRLSGSIWPLVLMHAVEDAFMNAMFHDGHVTIDAGRDLLVSPLFGAVPLATVVALGLVLRQIRLARSANDATFAVT